MKNIHSETMKEFVEKGADIEHDRWARWQKYLHSLCTPHIINSLNTETRQYEEIKTGGLVISKERVIHWEKEIATPYSKLAEELKEYDRKETRNYLPLILTHFIDKKILEIDLEIWLLRLKCEPEIWTVKQALQSLLKDNK